MNTPDNRRPVRPRAPFDFDAPQPGERRDPVIDHEHLADTLTAPVIPRDLDHDDPAHGAPATVDEAVEERMADARGFQSVATINERTATTLGQYTSSILENIRALKERLDELERFFVDDAKQVNERITEHMNNGKRVNAIMQGIANEIKDFERRRGDLLAAHAKGGR